VANIDIETVVSELRERIAARRLAGDYPEGLEEELESEFRGMMRAVDRSEVDTSLLHDRVEEVNSASHRINSDVGLDSRVPGGSAAHAAIGRIVQRHTGPLAESVRGLGFATASALDESRRLFEAQNSADQRQLHDALAGVFDRLAVIDHLSEIVRDLEQRVAQLENRLPAP
jgi:hypothetical protein